MVVASALAQVAEKPTCAILTFEAKGGEISTTAVEMLSDRFSTEFDRLNKYRMVSRSQMKEILQTQKFSLSEACSANECAVEAGKLLGVSYIVYGTIGKLGSVYSINSFMADVETGEQVRSATSDSRGGIEEALTALMAVNVRQLLGYTVPAEMTKALQRPAQPAIPEVAPTDLVYFQAQEEEYSGYRSSPPRPVRPPPEPQDFYFGPRLGISTYSGVVGIEAQINHISLSGGILPTGFATGLKYYFDPFQSCWYLGICYMRLEEEDDGWIDDVVGGGMGYRWRWESGWELTLGAGASVTRETDTWSEETETYGSPVIDLVVGYSF